MGFSKLVGVLKNNYTKTLENIKIIPNNHHNPAIQDYLWLT